MIFIEGYERPLIVVKKDGGYNYASTDLSALWLDFFKLGKPLSVLILHDHHIG